MFIAMLAQDLFNVFVPTVLNPTVVVCSRKTFVYCRTATCCAVCCSAFGLELTPQVKLGAVLGTAPPALVSTLGWHPSGRGLRLFAWVVDRVAEGGDAHLANGSRWDDGSGTVVSAARCYLHWSRPVL